MPLRYALPVMVALVTLHTATVRADAPPMMLTPAGLIGVWAGERMSCAAPRSRLHVFRRERTFHPRIFDDVPAHACKVLSVRGRTPEYRLHLRCRAFGRRGSHRERPVLQTAQLSEGGMRLEIGMIDTSDGSPLRKEHLYRCSRADAQSRIPRRYY